MLAQRLVVAAVGLPLLAGLLFLPEQLFAAVVTLVIAAGTAEFILTTPHDPSRTSAVAGGVMAALLAATLRTVEAAPEWLPLALIAVTVLALVLMLWSGPAEATPEGAWWLGAVLYVGALSAHWLLLRASFGTQWVVVMLAVTFATDTGAYATGKLIGRHILWRAISPGKTWEGFAGGMLAGGLMAVALPWSLGISPGWVWLAAMAVLLPFAGIVGDFLESALKRRIGVKDMSNVLPGHGGLLDRLDSLLLVGPCLYWLLTWSTRIPQ